MLIAVIIACEVGFWVLLAAGLVARYLLRRRRLGAALLVCAPLVDLVLLTATVLDLRRGGSATFVHSLAGIYIGVSVGFGHRMVSWADAQFAHRFAGGPAPARKPKYGIAHAAAERSGWYAHLRAWAVGCGLLGVAVLVIGDTSRTAALSQTIAVWTIVLAIDAVYSFSFTFAPRRARDTHANPVLLQGDSLHTKTSSKKGR